MENKLLTTNRKALTINLDPSKYGTLAEIGAGQETVRGFFQAGGSAGTIAKSISAYDMKFSDEIYGKAGRYVSEERLVRMLEYEYALLHERLADTRGAHSTFFAFANTVAAKSYQGTHDCHGWLGVRFQSHPKSEPNDIVIHVRMLDKENVQQQHALGIIGINLIYGAFFLRDTIPALIRSLLDNLTKERIEVDLIKFLGPHFQKVDNRLMNLQLIQQGLTHAIMFSHKEGVIQPSDVLYKKAILVERGSFRPVTRVNIDMIEKAHRQFSKESEVAEKEVAVVMEITMKNLLTEGEVDPADFLARVDLLTALGYNVLISNYPEYYRLAGYFRNHSKAMIGIVLGANNLVEIFNEKYYEGLDGGILESFGRMFSNTVKLYVYPMRKDAVEKSVAKGIYDPGKPERPVDENLRPEDFVDTETVRVPSHLRHLYRHLKENSYIAPVSDFDSSVISLPGHDILESIRKADEQWEKAVPQEITRIIRERSLFGWGSEAPPRKTAPERSE